MSHMLSHDQDFSTRRKKTERKRREVDKRCAISKQSSHDTRYRWERETMWGIWGGGNTPRMRIRPVAIDERASGRGQNPGLT